MSTSTSNVTDPTKSPPEPTSQSEKPVEIVQPNLYQLQGGTIHVTYSTTSIEGKAHFNYQDANQTTLFRGDEIRTAETDIGLIVTVTLRRGIDTGSTTFSVLLPNVNLERNHSATVTAVGITTVHRFSVIPAFNRGQTELYQHVTLNGTAQMVFF